VGSSAVAIGPWSDAGNEIAIRKMGDAYAKDSLGFQNTRNTIQTSAVDKVV
jgi:hypothetical protein